MVDTRSQTKMAQNADIFALLAEMKKSMKKGQEEMKEGMKKRQEEMKNQLQGVKGQNEEVKNELQRKIEEIEGKVQKGIEGVEDKVQRKIEEVEDKVQEKMEEVEEKVQVKIDYLNNRLSELEDRPINFAENPELTYLKPTVKSLIFDGQMSWAVFKTQFEVVSPENGWNNFVKASQRVTSSRGSAAEVLQGIPSDKFTDLMTIENDIEARFGEIRR
ncbi:hypothetical protein AVEN_72487-1 [Araneus ventricosus]|uniref:Uncharacterized protein n=1 Tax=Araneus ventricosus TaxID=182803 RepID=A0A4Y2G8G0_ARAVE|nr:hypothetical protein AVEN_72487-1 [Araneus ventricosus]